MVMGIFYIHSIPINTLFLEIVFSNFSIDNANCDVHLFFLIKA
jgi:hypothetical protein